MNLRSLICLSAGLTAVSLLLVGTGCGRPSEEVFVAPRAETEAAEASPREPPSRVSVPQATSVESLRIKVISPTPNDHVPQTGSQVRFTIIGDLPADARPQAFLLDATGLSSNYWVMDCDHESDGTWSCGVQYGLGGDSGMKFGVRILVLGEADCRPVGSVGPLPTSRIAASDLISVVRE